MFRILCVEDASEMVEILTTTLENHQLTFASTVKDALRLLDSMSFSLMLLDVALPDGSGFEILAHLQGTQKSIPVICLTGKKDFGSKVSAFSLGADDFIQKPFDPRELKLRVDAKLRKTEGSKQAQDFLRIGDLISSAEEQRLRRSSDDRCIDLTTYEFRIFHLLARTPNKVFKRDEILSRIWTDSLSVSDRTIDVHISNLRRKLQGTQVTVETVIGTGYRISIAYREAALRDLHTELRP